LNGERDRGVYAEELTGIRRRTDRQTDRQVTIDREIDRESGRERSSCDGKEERRAG